MICDKHTARQNWIPTYPHKQWDDMTKILKNHNKLYSLVKGKSVLKISGKCPWRFSILEFGYNLHNFFPVDALIKFNTFKSRITTTVSEEMGYMIFFFLSSEDS